VSSLGTSTPGDSMLAGRHGHASKATGDAGDQRMRLLAAAVEVAAAEGYARARIGDIAKQARVSRATFYELFADKEECFLVAYRREAERVAHEVAESIQTATDSDPTRTALTRLLTLADSEGAVFSFLTQEAPGERLLIEREGLFAALEQHIETGRRQTKTDEPVADIPLRCLLGGVLRVIGIRLGRGEIDAVRMVDDVVHWTSAYEAPRARLRWTAVVPAKEALELARGRSSRALFAPQRLPRGRHRLPEAVVKKVQRERILHATASVIAAKGYADTTVADIVAEAGLSRDVFYAHLPGKREALNQATRFIFEQCVAVMAGAFFTSEGEWPDRLWESALALARFLASAPSFAHVAFIDAYTSDRASASGTDEMFLGFAIFLEDGFRYSSQSGSVPRLVPEGIIGAIIETAALFIRQGRTDELPGLVPLGVYVAIAPFTGITFANELVDRKLGGLRQASG
jgi:AcrR family transcriptional regulator